MNDIAELTAIVKKLVAIDDRLTDQIDRLIDTIVLAMKRIERLETEFGIARPDEEGDQ